MARRFNGTTDKLQCNAAAISSQICTLSAWFWPTDLTVRGFILAVTSGSNVAPIISLGYDGTLVGDPLEVLIRSDANEGGVNTFYTANSVVTTGWQHGCIKGVGATERYVILNGDIANRGVGTLSIGNTFSVNRTAIGVLSRTTDALFFPGQIAHAAIWNIALSDTEIIALARGASPLRIRPAALVGYWPLAGSGAVESDAVGKNNMLVVGATAAGNPPRIWVPRYKQRAYYVASGVVNASITQVAATVTATGGTQTVDAVVIASAAITQVAANVTATGGTQAVTAHINTSVTQVAANITASGGTQVIATVNNASITQVTASVTATGGTQGIYASTGATTTIACTYVF